MLTGKKLGEAIAQAIEKKGVPKVAVARHFHVKPPSIQDWINKGTIDKGKLPALWEYFADVVGPAHWGLASFPSLPAVEPIVREEPARYGTVTLFPNPLLEELLAVSRRISDRGLIELIGQARLMQQMHPKAVTGNNAK